MVPAKTRWSRCAMAATTSTGSAPATTPAGWNMLQHMMQNVGAPIAPEDWPIVTTYLTKNFPGAAAARRGRSPGARPGDHQAVGRADHRLAPARSARHQGRRDLVDRAIVEQARPHRSEDRRDPGVPAQVAPHRPARTDRRPRRQHLVHRQQRRLDRQARSEDRRHHRIPAARPERQRPAHADLRSRWHPVVHGSAGQHGRPARSQDRRDQARHAADAAMRGPTAWR